MKKLISLALILVLLLSMDPLASAASTRPDAEYIVFGKEYTCTENDSGWYKFIVPYSCKVDFSISSTTKYPNVEICDYTADVIQTFVSYTNNSIFATSIIEDSIYLNKGVYYFHHRGNSTFQLNYTKIGETFPEEGAGSNNTAAEADKIDFDKKYTGLITKKDTADIYEITLDKSSRYRYWIEFSSKIKIELRLYNERGESIVNTYYSTVDNEYVTGVQTNTHVAVDGYTYDKSTKTHNYWFVLKDIPDGKYYLCIEDGLSYNIQGTYDFFIGSRDSVTNALSEVPNDICVYVNGREVLFDQPPVIDNGRTLVPLRAIFEALGASVAWDSASQTVTSTRDDTTVKATIGNTTMYKNDKAVTLDVPAKIVNSRTLVPVRAIAEAFGSQVQWDGKTKTVIIKDARFPYYKNFFGLPDFGALYGVSGKATSSTIYTYYFSDINPVNENALEEYYALLESIGYELTYSSNTSCDYENAELGLKLSTMIYNTGSNPHITFMLGYIK